MHSVLIPVHSDVYALPIECVREVLAGPTVTALATAPPVILGLINLRGEIVPLLDTAALLGLGTATPVAFAVVVHTAHGPAALAVTGFPERADLTDSVGRSELRATTDTYRLNQQVVIALDVEVLLDPERLGGHDMRESSHSAGLI